MAFDLVRMPPELSRGFARSKDWGTSVVRFGDMGAEERVRTRERPALKWQAAKGLFVASMIDTFEGFIEARGGAHLGFRFCDLSNFSTNPTNARGTPSALDQFLGYGDGATQQFSLRRVIPSTANDLPQRLAVEDRFLPIVNEVDAALARKIGLPANHLFMPEFAIDAVPVSTVAWNIDLRNRRVNFSSPPPSGSRVTWGGYYDWPVRLGEDADRNFESMRESWNAAEVPNIPLVGLPWDSLLPETDDPGGAGTLSWIEGAPILHKYEKKVWECTPGGAGLAVFLEDFSDLNDGGPHIIIINRSGFTFLVKDELTGSTIDTAATAGSLGSGLMCFVRRVGAARSWFTVRFNA